MRSRTSETRYGSVGGLRGLQMKLTMEFLFELVLNKKINTYFILYVCTSNITKALFTSIQNPNFFKILHHIKYMEY